MWIMFIFDVDYVYLWRGLCLFLTWIGVFNVDNVYFLTFIMFIFDLQGVHTVHVWYNSCACDFCVLFI